MLGVPAAEVQDFDGVQRDVLAVDLVDVASHHALGIGHDGDAVGAQDPDLARDAAPVAGQEPVGVALQLQRADGLLEQFKAAGQRIGLAQQLLERMVVDADTAFALQPEDAQRDKGGRFGDAVDGDVDPGRLLVDAARAQVDGRAKLVAVVSRDRFNVGALVSASAFGER